MSGIIETLLDKFQAELQVALIDNIADDDQTRAGIVALGPLQGDPDPDVARISVTIHENDPDKLVGGGLNTSMGENWDDEIIESEVGGIVTWARRFTVKARCLLVDTREDLKASRKIASTVRSRIEKTLITMRFSDTQAEGEYVSFGVDPENIHGNMIQSGGAPDAYDFLVKIRFQLYTTTIGGLG